MPRRDRRAGVGVVRGDVIDGGTVVAEVRGAETVLHLAACARAWARDPAEFTAVNVHTVERLLESAHAAGVSRLVHVSTMLTLPPGRPAPLDGLAARPTPYEESKRAGERLVESYAAAGRHAGIVHPTRGYGSGPRGPSRRDGSACPSSTAPPTSSRREAIWVTRRDRRGPAWRRPSRGCAAAEGAGHGSSLPDGAATAPRGAARRRHARAALLLLLRAPRRRLRVLPPARSNRSRAARAWRRRRSEEHTSELQARP